MKRSLEKRSYLSSMEGSTSSEAGKLDLGRIGLLLFRNAAEGLVVVDERGTIRLHNPRLHSMFGYEEGELDERPIEVLIPDALKAKHVAHRTAYHKHPAPRMMGIGMDLRGKRKDGSVFPVEISLNHFTVEDRMFVMGLVTDITLRYDAEEALHRTNQELEERVEQRTAELRNAEQSVREALEKERELHALKGRFVSMASHEFRTPLSTIMSSVDLIGRYTGNEAEGKVGKHVARIRTKVREMTAMLNEFLSLERIEQGQVECNPTPLDIVDLCIGLIEELRQLARPGQSLDYDHTADERSVTLDHQMLNNVITNLVTNAIKYSHDKDRIMLRTVIADGRLSISVMDRGMGIPLEDQQHLFERFFRGSNATTIQGTGLGLNLVKRYLETMNGTIEFTSIPGNTVFTVRLPQHLGK